MLIKFSLLTAMFFLPATTAFVPTSPHTIAQNRQAAGFINPRPPLRRSRLIPKATLSVAETVAGGLFPLSLPPYIAFLYFASFEGNKMPKLAEDGFKFLLVFVFGSIPAAIAASAVYGVSLADSDWLHGGAESLLTITNLLIVLGFRQGGPDGGTTMMMSTADTSVESGERKDEEGGEVRSQFSSNGLPEGPEGDRGGTLSQKLVLAACSILLPLLFVTHSALATSAVAEGVPLAPMDILGLTVHSPFLGGVGDLPPSLIAALPIPHHPEPTNALSVATWVIHVSSLVEWLVAMGLVWKFADVTRRPAWKGVTWGMLPLHSSGICACTYHLFYNQPSIAFLVALQAFLTCVGNTTVAFASYRLAVTNGWTPSLLPQFLRNVADMLPDVAVAANDDDATLDAATLDATSGSSSSSSSSSSPLLGFEDLGEGLEMDADYSFFGKLLVLSLLASYIVKYGELFVDFPFESSGAPVTALAFIAVPTALNVLKWKTRSMDPESDAFGMF